MNAATVLLIAALVSSTVACGATLDQTFKQLPARRRIGPGAYTQYVRAADLGNGLIWYPIVGITTTLSCVAAAVAGLLDHPTAARIAALSVLAVATVVFTAATSRAAPTLLTLRDGQIAEAAAEATLNRFARFNAIRAGGIALTVAAAVWALALTI
jgi:hypothetical protein